MAHVKKDKKILLNRPQRKLGQSCANRPYPWQWTTQNTELAYITFDLLGWLSFGTYLISHYRPIYED